MNKGNEMKSYSIQRDAEKEEKRKGEEMGQLENN